MKKERKSRSNGRNPYYPINVGYIRTILKEKNISLHRMAQDYLFPFSSKVIYDNMKYETAKADYIAALIDYLELDDEQREMIILGESNGPATIISDVLMYEMSTALKMKRLARDKNLKKSYNRAVARYSELTNALAWVEMMYGQEHKINAGV